MDRSKFFMRSFSFIVVLLVCVFLTGCSKVTKLNETVEIKNDKVKVTVLESQNVTIDNGELSLANGDYTKVKISIENIGNETYSWTSLNFELGEEGPSLNTLAESDALPMEVSASETITGYLYFPKTDSNVLIYSSNVSDSGKIEQVQFNIK